MYFLEHGECLRRQKLSNRNLNTGSYAKYGLEVIFFLSRSLMLELRRDIKTGTSKVGAIYKAQKAQFVKDAWDVFMKKSCFRSSASSLLKAIKFGYNVKSWDSALLRILREGTSMKLKGGPFALSFRWPGLALAVLVLYVKRGPFSVRSVVWRKIRSL